ncbi:MAG TPA: EAL domain-containing response regulator [Usitatibacter sp.]|nr:EAL domain-containing response regulator [Usitatibacter sp.]
MSIEELRFLVVEDHSFQRWVLGNLLESLGAKHVFSAADGQAALSVLADMDPPVDVVITDLDMPGMDGMEFIRHLADNWRRVSLVVVSSLDPSLVASVGVMAKAYGVSLLGAIEKPATAKKLAAIIASHGNAPHHPERAPVVFSPEEMAEGLREGQFEAFFQPKVEMQTMRITGAEANARWRHPSKGLIGPASFIRAFESNGLIAQLTSTILADSLRQVAVWHRSGLEATVSVNLSLTSLSDVTLAERMLAPVQAAGVEPRHVIFEVTESVATSEPGRVLENLSRLRMKGFGLSIDDYGTGYSSMQRLARIPFTELKIDQSFVKSAPTDASGRVMLESSLETAGKLRIPAVAEGVETHAQWDLLRGLGCPLAQGYFIATPLEAGEFLDWVRNHRQSAP